MRKTAFCICKNKDADQLHSNCAADQRLCFCYTDNTIPLLPKSEFSSLYPSSVAVQPGLCRTWSETPKTGFLTTRLKLQKYEHNDHQDPPTLYHLTKQKDKQKMKGMHITVYLCSDIVL